MTDNKADRIQRIAGHYGWDHLFDLITVSADVGSGKDKSAIFQKTLEGLAMRPDECVFIDNNPKNLLVPQSMGMHAVYFDHEKRDFKELYENLRKVGVVVP